MQGLKIKDLRQTELGSFLNVDLKEIFSAIGDPSRRKRVKHGNARLRLQVVELTDSSRDPAVFGLAVGVDDK